METGSNATASATIFLDFPPIARRARAEHFVSVMLTITEQSDGIGRIAGGCTNWFAGRDSDHSSCRRLVGEVRFDCVTIPFRFSRILRKRSRDRSARYKCEPHSLRDRLIGHRPHQVTIMHPLCRRLHQQNGSELLLRIGPEVRSRHAAPRKVADRSRQRISPGIRSHRKPEPETKPVLGVMAPERRREPESTGCDGSPASDDRMSLA